MKTEKTEAAHDGDKPKGERILHGLGVALMPITSGTGDMPTSGAPLINRWMRVRVVFSAFALTY